MNQFTFDGKIKTTLLGLMALGFICLVITFAADDALHTRFWTNYLHNTVFFTGIGFISLFILAAFTTAWAGWYTVVKRIFEAYSLFLIPGLALLSVVIIGLWGGFHHLYHWADSAAVAEDVVLKGKSSFLNNGWYTFGTLIFVGAWIGFALKLRSLSLDEDKTGGTDFHHHKKMRIWAAAFLPIGGFTSAAMVWQWVMSVDAHWYSTLFAWYSTVSWFVSAIALTILMVIFLKSMGYLQNVTVEHLHDLGKYMFAFTVFWTYLWFSQYMLIWYANVGEETVYFHERIHQYPVLFYGNLIINFVLPFLILLRNDTKRKYGTLIFTSVLLLFGHWWDFFQMIKPGTYKTAQEALAHHGGAHEAVGHAVSTFAMGFTIPGFLEIGTFVGFLAGFLYFAFSRLASANLQPQNDPYIGESLHHHV